MTSFLVAVTHNHYIYPATTIYTQLILWRKLRHTCRNISRVGLKSTVMGCVVEGMGQLQGGDSVQNQTGFMGEAMEQGPRVTMRLPQAWHLVLASWWPLSRSLGKEQEAMVWDGHTVYGWCPGAARPCLTRFPAPSAPSRLLPT